MKITYSKPLQALLILCDKAQNKEEAKAQYQLALICLQIKTASAEKTAVKLLRKSAKLNNVDAHFVLGYCYETGVGVRKNCHLAMKWYKLMEGAIFDYFYTHKDPIDDAAREILRQYIDDEEFETALDEMIESEQQEYSFEADLAQAQRGDVDAQVRFGDRFYYGQDIEIDREKALYWYKKAAEQGSESGIFKLAKHYETENNSREAAKWFGQYAKLRLVWFHERLRAAGAE